MVNLKRGMNFSPYHGWKIGKELAQDKYLKIAKDAGFDHIRYPYWLSDHVTEKEIDGDAELMRAMAEMTLANGLIPILDVHAFGEMNGKARELRGAFVRMWDSLAEKLADLDERVVFEILNEPSGALDDTALLNDIQKEVIGAIRRTNPTRTILAAVAHMNVIENLPYLELPEDDENIIVGIHEYTPMSFTHQGAWWVDPRPPVGVSWGNDEERKLLRDRMDMASDWAKAHNRKLHMGEFGVYETAPLEERARWTEYMVRLMEERDIAWACWEFSYGYKVYDLQKDEWIEPLLKALIRN